MIRKKNDSLLCRDSLWKHMAWVDRRRQQREMQATQTQQGLHSVLEARGLFFTFPMVGLCLVWIF